MLYKVIGIMSGSSLDGLDIVYTELSEEAGTWNFTILHASCPPYDKEWEDRLGYAEQLSAKEYLLLHTDYGRYIGTQLNYFIETFQLQHKVDLIASHGHTTFHLPSQGMTHQLGDGATIAAVTGLPVVSDLRSLDVAFGGQGAPIVPMGEKLLFHNYRFFLNIGGIANLSIREGDIFRAFDTCPANRVMNMLATEKGISFDKGGVLASRGKVNQTILEQLNTLDYYREAGPKSLANSFGVNVIYPLLNSSTMSTEDKLATMVEHICQQIAKSLRPFQSSDSVQLFTTGGGAFNDFLVERLSYYLTPQGFTIFIPEPTIVSYKEALIMALSGTLRWREQNTVLASVTGASRDSIGGALWLGTEA
jgi:anhydro-N-acetylmuramic acid kinase